MVSRASGGLGDDTVEPQCRQIQFIDERFNNPDRVVLRHVVIQAVREQRSLPPVLAFHKTFHPASPNSRTLNYHVRAFSHALAPNPTFPHPLARLNSGLEDPQFRHRHFVACAQNFDPYGTSKVSTGGSILSKVRATIPCSTVGE